MNRYELAAAARSDLLQIWTYIAIDSPTNADQFIDRIVSKLQMLAELPRLGIARAEFGDELRSFPVGDYLIFYRPTLNGIQIVRILHGAQRLEDLLE